MKYVPEAIVLEKATANDPDEWPCFVLRDAVVYRKTADGRLEIANVCNVDLDGPFIVRGRLEVDMEEHRDLRALPNCPCCYSFPVRLKLSLTTSRSGSAQRRL